MPGTDTSNLAETLVRFARQLLGAPSGSDTIEAVTLGDSNDIDDLILLEDGVDVDFLFKQVVCKVDFLRDGATIDLDLHQVGLLLFERGLADLGMCEETHNGTVLLDAFEVAGNGCAAAFSVFLGVLGECLLLALVPVLVEAPLDLVAQVFGPYSSERTQTTRGLNVTNDTNSNHL